MPVTEKKFNEFKKKVQEKFTEFEKYKNEEDEKRLKKIKEYTEQTLQDFKKQMEGTISTKTDELMAEFDQTGLKAEPREAFLETFRRIVDPNDKRIKSNVDLRTEGSWDFFADTLKGSKEIVG
ncbi:MAG: hypothetical protein ACI4PJ_01825 [Acutalibacteraceae bacterium]